MKHRFRDIMNEMDKIEKIEITPDLIDDLKDYFKNEIESEEKEKSDDDKVASSIVDGYLGEKRYAKQARI